MTPRRQQVGKGAGMSVLRVSLPRSSSVHAQDAAPVYLSRPTVASIVQLMGPRA